MPNPRPKHHGMRCAEPTAAVAASTPTVGDRSGCASTIPGISSHPSPRCPSRTYGDRERRAFSLSLSLYLFLSRFEALVRRFVRLGESTCSTASRVRSAARCLCNRVGMKFTIGTNPGSATISTAAAAAASVPTTCAARFRGNRNPGSFVHFVNTSPGYVPLGIGVFVWKILFMKFSLLTQLRCVDLRAFRSGILFR